MSTVDKKTADRVIAGEYPEDGVIAIIQYENMFNGALAYKLIFSQQNAMIQYILDGKSPSLINPSIYWRKNPA